MWTALILGVTGSLHCLAMCGPIAFALPLAQSKNKLLSLLYYHLGRLFAYGLLGAAVGWLGGGFVMAGVHQAVAIIMGVLLSLFGLQQLMGLHLFRFKILTTFFNQLHHSILSAFQQNRSKSIGLLGMLNGILPCGLVYVALSGALVLGHPTYGFLYMLFFGIGTLPMMIGIVLLKPFKKKKFRFQAGRLIPVITLLFGLFILIRGLGLSIPYISPNASQLEIKVGSKQACDPNP